MFAILMQCVIVLSYLDLLQYAFFKNLSRYVEATAKVYVILDFPSYVIKKTCPCTIHIFLKL